MTSTARSYVLSYTIQQVSISPFPGLKGDIGKIYDFQSLDVIGHIGNLIKHKIWHAPELYNTLTISTKFHQKPCNYSGIVRNTKNFQFSKSKMATSGHIWNRIKHKMQHAQLYHMLISGCSFQFSKSKMSASSYIVPIKSHNCCKSKKKKLSLWGKNYSKIKSFKEPLFPIITY